MENHPQGTYTLLDVRQPTEYETSRIPGATLIPLTELPHSLDRLDPQKPVVVYCAVGGRSRAAAQLLAGQGFEAVYNLKGGIKAWQGITAAGPAEMGMTGLRGDESPAEIFTLAYGMEEGLRAFYQIMADRTGVPDLSHLFKQLAGMEEAHKRKLFQGYLDMNEGGTDPETFESHRVAAMMEGGVTTEAFLEANGQTLESTEGVLTVAMMLEVQALDLYMRYAEKMEQQHSAELLRAMAEEEKGHLRALGTLMEKQQGE
jgi:rhodanese-related sulfurtransferase/rubrerythrin